MTQTNGKIMVSVLLHTDDIELARTRNIKVSRILRDLFHSYISGNDPTIIQEERLLEEINQLRQTEITAKHSRELKESHLAEIQKKLTLEKEQEALKKKQHEEQQNICPLCDSQDANGMIALRGTHEGRRFCNNCTWNLLNLPDTDPKKWWISKI